ncbi:hypothetical protein AB0L56_03355 [Streptomyces sp. NPDC052079]|uniref:hypothetical protein n=1 Tax=Streptomyces sp. NPDC052079 TaxID=3155526 RepID=UPI00343E1808
MDTTQTEALIAMVAVLGLFVLTTLPALLGIARDRRIDRQIKRAEEARAAAERPVAPPPARPEEGAAPHRTARAA